MMVKIDLWRNFSVKRGNARIVDLQHRVFARYNCGTDNLMILHATFTTRIDDYIG